MAGQLWSAANGYMASPTLSAELRTALQPLTRFLQFCDVEVALGKHKGQTYTWNVYGDTADEGGVLVENQPVPETTFPVSQGTVTLVERGISVPYTGLYDDLSEHNVKSIIHKTLKNNANRALDTAAAAQFDLSILTATSTSATAFTLQDDATFSGAATNGLALAHVRTMADTLQERNIPVFDGENYVCISRPSTIRAFRNELDAIRQYVDEGWMAIMNGEVGRYENIRFVTQTNIASKGWTNTDAAYFFGADTVTEVIANPVEIRGKIPDDYGRSKGIMWYCVNAFGITHSDQTNAATKAQARIIRWGSTS